MKFISEKVLLLFFILNSIIYSQSYISPGFTDEVRNSINNKLSQQFDENIKVVFVLNIDSTLGDGLSPYYPEIGEVKNSYSTLTNCLVFTAIDKIENKGLVGVFKDGNIIWHNNLEISPLSVVYPLNIPIIKDINKDGIIDILTTWVSGMNSNPLITLWIYSWNGFQGFKINNSDRLGQSLIKSDSDNSFDLLDIEGDGVWEIVGYERSYKNIDSLDIEDSFNYSPIIYKWDNTLYTKQSLLIDVYHDIFPRNKINEKVKATIIKVNNIIRYNYLINNLGDSNQNINEISLLKLNEDINYFLPQYWSFVKYDSLFYFWNDGILGINRIDKNCNEEITIVPQTYKLPAISKYYIQGWNGDFNTHITDLSYNSKSSFTIVPADFLDTLNIFSFIDTLLSFSNQSYKFNWIADSMTEIKYDSLFNLAKSQLQLNNNNGARVTLQTVLQQVDVDSTNNLTSEAYALFRYNTEYLLEKIPQSSPNLVVNLKNSLGNQISASNVKYYEGSWKDAVNNGDGTFTIITTRPTVSIRIFYEYASQQVDNVPAQNNTYTFTTVNAAVQLKNSLGNLIDAGTVQYYAGAWRTFGTTTNGVATKELLPINYSFRMTYEFASIDKQQNLSVDPTVVFQTVNAAVQLKNSLGNLMPAPMGDAGTVQYYAGAWRSFGTTTNGVAYKELLPINYSFRMTYEFVSKDKQQNLSTNPVVDFSTVLCSVKVSKTSNNQPINNAAVKYYSGAWRNLGTTNSSGIATKELLPANLSFRATSGNVSLDKQQDISVNSLVEILLNIAP